MKLAAVSSVGGAIGAAFGWRGVLVLAALCFAADLRERYA